VILANGILPDLEFARAVLRTDDRVICADAGARHARLLGRVPDLVVGDMDSLEAEDREWLVANGVREVRYPRDKDQTDLELAIEHALADGPEELIIMAASGGRLDHTLGNIALLDHHRLLGRQCSLDDGIEQVLLCRTRIEVRGLPGDLVSLLPWGVPAEGVWTAGLRWSLRGDTLLAESSRGISNEMTADRAEIRVQSGRLLVIHRRRLPTTQAGS
jgi:thiamine pyrophosphokinase